MAVALVGDPGAAVTGAPGPTGAGGPPLAGADPRTRPPIRFYKMSGSGNDFVFFDARGGAPTISPDPTQIAALCALGVGVGADGVVILDQPAPGVVRIAYYNSDGSRAALCGNATLCAARLAVHLGAAPLDEPFVVRTDTGDLRARVGSLEGPSFELSPVRALDPDVRHSHEGQGSARESRVGYALAGVPHLVVRVGDVDEVDLGARGAALRRATEHRPEGANVNFVSSGRDGWRMRTFERGVEGETLACGTGAVACAAILHAWDEAGWEVRLVTRSGRLVTVRLQNGRTGPTLLGEGRLVFEGTLHDWRPDAPGDGRAAPALN